MLAGESVRYSEYCVFIWSKGTVGQTYDSLAHLFQTSCSSALHCSDELSVTQTAIHCGHSISCIISAKQENNTHTNKIRTVVNSLTTQSYRRRYICCPPPTRYNEIHSVCR